MNISFVIGIKRIEHVGWNLAIDRGYGYVFPRDVMALWYWRWTRDKRDKRRVRRDVAFVMRKSVDLERARARAHERRGWDTSFPASFFRAVRLFTDLLIALSSGKVPIPSNVFSLLLFSLQGGRRKRNGVRYQGRRRQIKILLSYHHKRRGQ